MASSSICSHCLRTLRQNFRAQTTHLSKSSNRRQLSATAAQWKPESSPQPSASKRSNIRVAPPTTIGTGTSNVTAGYPEDPIPETSQSQSPPKPASAQRPPSVSHMQKQIQSSLSAPSGGIGTRLAQGLRNNAPKAVTQSYITYGETEALFQSCAAQADYTIRDEERMNVLTGKGPPKAPDGADLGHPIEDTWWFNTIGLLPTFSTWSQVTFLHMYVLVVRLRALDAAEFNEYHRYLIEHFSNAAEDRMVLLHNLAAKGVRNKYLKDLFLQWRGVLAANDEAMVKGDAVLAGAIWRNLFQGKEDVDWEKVALVVAYLRRAITKVGTLELNTIIAHIDGPEGIWAQSQKRIQELVDRPNKRMNEPFSDSTDSKIAPAKE
ncbi:Serine carboxypeptidase 3 [Elasticomyces elasticus]|uniref:Serine carboxypeptidase 3 n=1 Tax=Exophiala sideris TaxID=1016849 RepID=A0ABR0J3U3_9EURO|nr:Serine carboxypeptidase 3 [Elasticomyces elasticus]KAK5026982.1 Serine carboxypeptidase 3 [Exophiala sideris]KAK5033986.1 Serine carboxypeptidase 3 [Exophiala sideris]KAK5055740.1 Serine carboxypeptidase 3 [Exophiala sideris]KAK5180928.1 Serine carboxypeptidase 3 [Eurotiomycetes sp. CCFEE 6388]